MVFLDDDKESPMATSVKAEPSAQAAQRKAANFFQLSHKHDKSTISYTASNLAGQPVFTYDDGKATRTFTGKEVNRQDTTLGTLVTVILKTSVDGPRELLTLVLPEVLVNEAPENLSVPAIFHTTVGVIPPKLGPVQTYEVKIYSGTASFVLA
jgi:hypothetical protein